MRQWNASDVLGTVVGSYRLENVLSEGDGVAVFLGGQVESAFASSGLPVRARVTVYPITATLAMEEAAIRARFARELEAAKPVLASGEDAAAGVLYLVTPAPSLPPSYITPPPLTAPPIYNWGTPPTGVASGMPYYPQGSFTTLPPITPGQRRSGLRLTLTVVVLFTLCVTMSGVAVGGAALLIAARGALGSAVSNGSYGSSQADSGCSVSAASVSRVDPLPASALPDSKQVLRAPSVGGADVTTLDPPEASDTTSQQYASLVFPGLLALDRNQCLIPWAAQSLPQASADGYTYTFKLRPGLKWSDGVPITSQTFAYSINRALNPCDDFGAAYYLYNIQDAYIFNTEPCDTATGSIGGNIQTLIGDSIMTPDPLTLQISLDYQGPYFLTAFAYPASDAVPQQLISQYGNKYIDHLANDSGFGGNLFKVTRWDHTGALQLTRNDAFWGGKPALRELDVHFYQDSGAAYRAYQAGKVDMGSAPDALLGQARGHSGFHQIPDQQITYYGLNWNVAPFTDQDMRQAFAIALDKAALLTYMPPWTALATNHIDPQGMVGYNPGLKGPDGTASLRGDTTLAHKLATTYATKTGCGTATDFSQCPVVTLNIVADPGLLAQAHAARQMWLKAMPKYPINIATWDFDTLSGYVSNGSAQLWELTWVGDYPDPEDFISNNMECGGGSNNGNVCDKAADKLLNDADANPSQTTRLAEYQKAEQLLVTDVGWIPLSQATIWWETNPTVRNYTVSSTGLVSQDVWQTVYLTAR
jgi:peptide/nickel transport system substrate-binding protein/oligopeptide transport system substrate-binding protein